MVTVAGRGLIASPGAGRSTNLGPWLPEGLVNQLLSDPPFDW